LRLYGREPELQRLGELIDSVRDSGWALIVRGEAGIGKTALLESATDRARSQGMRVLTTVGVESHAQVPFVGLHQLLRPAWSELGRLPAPQRMAVEAAFGLVDEAAPDIFLIALAALDLIAEMASEAPLLLVVEDAQWVDSSTCRVLAFVALRLEHEPAALLFAVREGIPNEIEQVRLPELRLGRLAESDARDLLEALAPQLAPDVRDVVLAEADGNPLALVELPIALAEQDRGDSLLLEPLPLTQRLQHVFAGRIDELPPQTGLMLLLAALAQDSSVDELLAAAALLTGGRAEHADLELALSVGLGTIDGGRFRFRHPLIRSAIEQARGPEERRAAHAALADALEDDLDRAVWHRAAATRGRDEVVAAALAAAGERAKARGGSDVAIAAFERSAALTPDAGVRALRLWQAAELGWQSGRSQDTRRLFTDARRLGLPPYEDAAAARSLESLTGTMSSGDAIVGAFVAAAEGLLAEGEHRKAMVALETASARAYWGNLGDETKGRASAVARTIDVPPDDPLRLCFLGNVDPIGNGREVLDQLAHLSAVGIADGESLLAVGLAATVVWADDVAIPFLRAAAGRFRAEGRLGLLALALASEAWAHLHRGAVLPSLTAAAESGRLAAETGLTLYVQAARLAEAITVAQRGQDATARTSIAETEAVLHPLGATPLLAMVALARGRVELAAGHYADAYQRLARIFDQDDVAFHPFLRGHALADLADAARGGDGDLDLVRGYVDEWQRIAADTTAPYLKTQAAYAAAVLSEDNEAEQVFRAAIASAGKGWEFYAARARLAHGVWLRRIRRRAADARAPLREAAETFSALGQETYAERSLTELRASGETARRRVPEAWAELTPQELQIAQLAAQGLSNKEIGERLFISSRTVGTHLYHLFPKLGISSRAELGSALKYVM
jgi:DNA-binding NarL/FixJ family response regulator